MSQTANSFEQQKSDAIGGREKRDGKSRCKLAELVRNLHGGGAGEDRTAEVNREVDDDLLVTSRCTDWARSGSIDPQPSPYNSKEVAQCFTLTDATF